MGESNTVRRSDSGGPATGSPPRGLILRRCLSGTCPRCGGPGLFRGEPTNPEAMPRWGFQLEPECPYCGLRFQEESGVTLGTTVVGYVLVVGFVVAPLLLAMILGWIPGWLAIASGVILSFVLPTLLYPLLLRITLASWFGFHPDAFNQNDEPASSPHS